jgi:hypothetical protein
VVLTRAGLRLLREIRPRYFKGAQEVAGHLAPERAAAFIEELERMVVNAKRAAGEASPPSPRKRRT